MMRIRSAMMKIIRLVFFAGLLLPLAHGRVPASLAYDAGGIPGSYDDVIGPTQITASPDTVFDMAVCGKTRRIIYITGIQKPTTIWIASIDPADAVVPRRLVSGNSEKTSPAISPDGRYAAFVGTDYDVKGDIFLIDLKAESFRPIRLTGRDTEDGGPCFSPDSRRLYFHQSGPGRVHSLVFINPASPDKPLKPVETGGDAMFCAASPSGDKLVFVSFRDNSSGNIFLLDLSDGRLRRLTQGRSIDMSPSWSDDGRTLYFAGINADTNQDQRVTAEDNPVIFRMRTDIPDAEPFPVTPYTFISLHPYCADGTLYFLSNYGGNPNCWALPAGGPILPATDADAQMGRARRIAGLVPYQPYLSLLAYFAVLENFPEARKTGALAAYAIGSIFQERDMPLSAEAAYGRVSRRFKDIEPQASLALIRQAGIDFDQKAESSMRPEISRPLIDDALSRIDDIAGDRSDAVGIEALFEKARLLSSVSARPDDMIRAIGYLDRIAGHSAADDHDKARALFLAAEIYDKTGIPGQSSDTLVRIIHQYPDEPRWTVRAADGVIDRILAGLPADDPALRARRLQQIADENRDEAPALTMSALNRIGDIYYNDGQWEIAKSAFRQVIDNYPLLSVQTAAARLALAEILFREERFRDALDLYETEIDARPPHDAIFQMARNGYISKKIASGEFHFRLGEISTAQNIFRELMDFDYRIIEAHRGYIKCAAAFDDIDRVLAMYKSRLADRPDDPVLLYAAGLCLTYLETPEAVLESENLLREAIRRNGRIEYFHQSLGYVCEISETVYGRKNGIELALASYQKAYFLNNPRQNPENAANLALNLGNAFYLLGQYGKAFEFYTRRMVLDVDFDHPDTEIVFYKRMGECAFQVNDLEKTIEAFTSVRDLIQSRMDPVAASRAFDRMHRYIMDQIMAPASNQAHLAEKADAAARMQSENSLRVAEMTREAAAPPSDQWRHYRTQMARIHAQQQDINRRVLAVADELNRTARMETGRDMVPNPKQHLAIFSRMIADALDHPERLVEMQAEVLDRLGLAYQETGQWKPAMEAFEGVYAINEKTDRRENLARNRRSIAYCAYQSAEETSGDARVAALRSAADGFRQTLDLLDKYGISEPEKTDTTALLDFTFQVSLDNASATQAAHGFSLAQEKRLAETFLARIYLEMDHLSMAVDQLNNQLRRYLKKKSVSEKDRFGVALLFHRAGLLANGSGDHANAFDYFSRSATLGLEMGNSVSTMTNIVNMISVIEQIADIPGIDDAGINFEAVIRDTDVRMMKLIETDPVISSSPRIPAYHNRMGVFYARTARGPENDIAATVYGITDLLGAYSRFQKGIDAVARLQSRMTRDLMETAAMLHLNMAETASRLDDAGAAARHYQQALELSESGVFPDLKWRALVGLNRTEEALDVLASMTLTRAGCAPFEIIHAFSGLVMERFIKKDAESAFNLAERLAEIERFQRTAHMVRPTDPEEKQFYQAVYRRLARIREMENRLDGLTGDGDAHKLMRDRISTERGLLLAQTDNGTEIPDALRRFSNGIERERWIILMGLALQAEETGRRIADIHIRSGPENKDHEQISDLIRFYEETLGEYHDTAQNIYFSRPEGRPADAFSFLAPEPVEAMDIMDVMADDDMLIRIFSTGRPDHPFLVFTLTAVDLFARTVNGPVDLSEIITATGPDAVPYIAFESPAALASKSADAIFEKYPFVLSGAHLYRSLTSRKPFKSKLFAVPDMPGMEEIDESYAIRTLTDLPDMPDFRYWTTWSDTHTVLISGRLAPAVTVPTRPGQASHRFYAVYPDTRRRFRIDALAPALPSAGIAVLARSDAKDAYEVGHLFSLSGCPTLLFHDLPEPDDGWLMNFFKRYLSMSAIETVQSLSETVESREKGESEMPLFLGYKGMTPEASARFAEDNFVRYVRTGRAAFDAGDDVAAISMVDNAISVAEEIPKYAQYLPGLFQIGRESAYRSGSIEKALVYAQRLADRLETEQPDTAAHAEALLRLGLIHARREDHVRAIEPIETAVEIMSFPRVDDALVRAMTDLGIVLENATQYDSALSRFTVAADLSEKINLPELRAAQYLNIGRIYDLRLSRYAEAVDAYERALKIYRESDNHEKIAESLVNIGRCHRLMGNFSEADRHYREAMALIDDTGTPSSLRYLTILMEQANNAWFQGRYEEAFRLQRRVYLGAETGGFAGLRVMALNTSGLIWWTLGNYDRAVTELRQALKTAQSLKIRKDEIATTLNNIGLIHRDIGEYEEALTVFDQALAIDMEIGSQWAIAYDYRNQGLTWLKRNQPEIALPLFEQSYAISSAIGNQINAAKALLGLGNAQIDLENFAEAETTFTRALGLSRSMMLKETEWRSLFGLAKIRLEFYNDAKEAERHLREAIEVIEGLRAEMKIEALRESFLENKLSVYEALVLLLANQDRPAEAFEIAERSRARNFIDLLGNQPLTLGDAAEQALFEKIGLIRSEIEQLESMLAGATRPEEQKAYADRLESLKNDEDSTLLDIQALNPQLTSLVSVTPVDAADVLKTLVPGVALASYYVTDDEILCWVLTPGHPARRENGKIRLVRIPADKTALEQEVLTYRRILQNLEPFEKYAAGLYSRLVAPLLPYMDDVKTLGIIPHGPLHYLSFATLFDGDRFLIDTHALFYLPSASILEYALSKQTASNKKKLEVLAVGNPDLGDPILDLPFAEQEVHAIGWNFPIITILTREKATRDWIVDNIDRFDIVHIASHGEFDPVNPLLSALKLAQPEGTDVLAGAHAGDLSARDIFGLTIRAELVVLSACQTGLGKISAGDDVVGLNRSFLYAGTHAVISSLWRVSDVSTAVLIKSFYRRYMELNKAESIRDAMRHVKSRYPHPGYWGAFTLVGDYE